MCARRLFSVFNSVSLYKEHETEMGFLACQQISSQTSDTKSVRPEHTVCFLVPSFSTDKSCYHDASHSWIKYSLIVETVLRLMIGVQGWLGLDDGI